MRPVRILVLVVGSTVGACSFTTIPDLTSGRGAAIEGGAPVTDASPATATEVGAPSVAGTFCARLDGGTFCDDFDTPGSLGRWTKVNPFQGGFGVALETNNPRSSPTSLVSRVLPGQPACAYATISHRIEGAHRRAHLAFSLRIDDAELDPIAPSVVAVLEYGSGGNVCQAYFAASTARIGVTEQIIHTSMPREEEGHPLAPPPVSGQWTRYEIDYDLAQRMLKVEIDGRSALAIPTAKDCPYAPGPVEAEVGLFCEAVATKERVAHHDDVVLTIRD